LTGLIISPTDNSQAASNVLIYNDGNLASSSSWSYQNCDQGAPSGDNYIIMTKSSSTVISAPLNLNGYSGKELNLKARTYGGVTSTSDQISIFVSIVFLSIIIRITQISISR